MTIPLPLQDDIQLKNCHIVFPQPEIIGFTGGAGYGHTGLYGNHMSSVLPLGGSRFRIYQTKRLWMPDRTTTLDIGFIDTDDLSLWPLIADHYTPLVIDGLPEGVSCAQPYVLHAEGRIVMFFWIHGAGMIRYVKCESDDGKHFRIVNLDNPCLYHPSDCMVRQGEASDGLLTIKDGLQRCSSIDETAQRKISNDATSVSYDPQTGVYTLFSVMLLNGNTAPERRVEYDNARDWIRVIHRRTSHDGIEWSDAELVLVPQENDRQDLQYYVLQHVWRNDHFVGIAGYYPVKDQIMELQPLASKDGCQWIRPDYGPLNIRDQIPGCDWAVNMLMPSGMIEHDGHLWFGATAFSCKHNESGKLMPEQYRQESLILRQRCDRWIGIESSGGTAEFVSHPKRMGDISIHAECLENVKVSLLSVFGRTLTERGQLLPDGSIEFGDSPTYLQKNDWIRVKLEFDTIIYDV